MQGQVLHWTTGVNCSRNCFDQKNGIDSAKSFSVGQVAFHSLCGGLPSASLIVRYAASCPWTVLLRGSFNSRTASLSTVTIALTGTDTRISSALMSRAATRPSPLPSPNRAGVTPLITTPWVLVAHCVKASCCSPGEYTTDMSRRVVQCIMTTESARGFA